MRQYRYIMTFLLLVVLQIIICNYLNLSQYLSLSVLPMAIMLLPIGCGTVTAMLIAFASGLAVDFLCDGLPGLQALSLVAVAYARTGIIRLVFGSEVFARKENISISKHGLGKVALALAMAQAIFLVIYIIADGAATRPLWFNSLKWLLSVLLGVLVSLVITPLVAPDNRD